MPIPEKISIQRMEDYHTHYLGKIEDGRIFFGYQTFVFPNGVPASDWEKHRREYVVLYLFDKDGNYIDTNHWNAGITAEINNSETKEKLQQMVRELGSVVYQDIEVRPFQTKIDGIVFGLVPNAEYGSVDLEPSSTISFQEPWDGEYYT